MSDSKNFLVERIEADLEAGTYEGRVVTRFPPEPNGYLHIGHAKAILTDFGLAARFGGRCHLRFDDTNPTVEEVEYVEAIQRDMRWLGCDWGEHLYYASDYFDQLYGFAQRLIKEGKAYVCSLSLEEIRATRGTVTEAGQNSPDRDRPVEESLALLEEMKGGTHEDGAYTVRAKIDMAHSNMKMRDPLMYRIRNVPHHRTGDTWHIYPMYDFAHGLSDAIEGITHSICTLEFENNRELYDWFVDALFDAPVPRQHEMARFAMGHIVTSKRKLIQLVTDGHVSGWDDPRMPTIAGLRRRGVPPEAIVELMARVGVSRADNLVDASLFDHVIRDTLNDKAPRRMGVLHPLPVEVLNWDEGNVDWIDASEWPHDVPKEGHRSLPFTRHLVIERDDFAVDPPKGFKRMTLGVEVRLRHGYLFTATEVETDSDGQVVGVRGTVDPDSRGGTTSDNRKVRGTIHWVSATEGRRVTVRLIERLFSLERPDDHPDGFLAALNPEGLVELADAIVEPALAAAPGGTRVQLERTGYFMVDPVDSRTGRPVLHRIVALKDSWTKAAPTAQAPLAAKRDTGRKRIRKSASDALDELIQERPELQGQIDRLLADGASEDESVVIGASDRLYGLYAQATGQVNQGTLIKWLVNDVRGLIKDDAGAALAGSHLVGLIGLVTDGELTNSVARNVLSMVAESGEDPIAVVDREGLRPLRDEAAIQGMVAQVVADNPDKVAAYRGGRANLRGFFVGQVMRGSGGRADPALVQKALSELLDGDA
ncbi:MAG: glutamine--tRNA ligase/YqeY domain fusion protein [Myxococcota bacterium]